jgi:hypothetical protein
MKRILWGAVMLALGCLGAKAQSIDDLNIQFHGYATQGFLYTTDNNIFTTMSSNGSPAWTEAVVNLTAQPQSKLRIGVQARYFVLGNYGNEITLDWAQADYKFNDMFGIRAGKVKTPSGMFNETQDIDPSYLWSLLPQTVYPIGSRNSMLAHYGGVVYGTLKMGPAGKLEYRGWDGERILSSNDGYFTSLREEGIVFPNGLYGVTLGAHINWHTPLKGLSLGAADSRQEQWGGPVSYSVLAANVTAQTISGTMTLPALDQPFYFGRYEKPKFSVAGEYTRTQPNLILNLAPAVPAPVNYANDWRSWYVMATYKPTSKLNLGIYDTQEIDYKSALGPARYSKDWAFSGRYDFNEFLYAKAEEHVIDGTLINYDESGSTSGVNPDGLQPNTKLTVLKLGVSF